MKKFLIDTKGKKTNVSTGKAIPSKVSSKLTALEKKQSSKLMSIFNYQYQESDLEQFVF